VKLAQQGFDGAEHVGPIRARHLSLTARSRLAHLATSFIQSYRKDPHMLKVTVELLPGGATFLRRTLATMSVANVSNLADVSNYDITVIEAANPLTGAPARMHALVVDGHERKQSVWKLIARAVAQMDDTEPVEF
jgi:hypothetical protein